MGMRMKTLMLILSGAIVVPTTMAAYFAFHFRVDNYEELHLARGIGIAIGGLYGLAYLIARIAIGVAGPWQAFRAIAAAAFIWIGFAGALSLWHEAITRIRFAAPRTITSNRVVFAHHALRDFRRDCGRFPTADEGLAVLVRDRGIAGWKGPYLDDKDLRDGYEQPLRYALVDDRYDVWSIGSDGVDGTDDDIRWDGESGEIRRGKAR
jgi:hypothetical protein